MPGPLSLRAALAVALASVLSLALLAAPALAFSPLKPPGKKVYWGVSDTGDPADFGQFADVLAKHPAVIQSFRTWGTDFDEVIRRWQTAVRQTDRSIVSQLPVALGHAGVKR